MKRDLIRDVSQEATEQLARRVRIMPVWLFVLGFLAGVALIAGLWVDIRDRDIQNASLHLFNLVPAALLLFFGIGWVVYCRRVLAEATRRMNEKEDSQQSHGEATSK
jgi:uncharacterized membrane protein